jgi:hypothetical protein
MLSHRQYSHALRSMRRSGPREAQNATSLQKKHSVYIYILCVCVCVCVCVRARARVRVCVCVYICVYI